MSDELKPCPLDAVPVIDEFGDDTGEVVFVLPCAGCGPYATEAEATDAWNTRSLNDGVRELARDVKLTLECCAGCDEGVSEDVAESEIMSWAGSPAIVLYRRMCALEQLP